MLRKKTLLFIIVSSLLLRLTFLGLYYFNFKFMSYERGIDSGNLAIHFLQGSSFNWNSEAFEKMRTERELNHRMLDYSDFKIDFSKSKKVSQLGDDLGYSLFISAIWWLTGSYNFLYVKFVQLVLDTMICCLLVFALMRITEDTRWANFAGWTYAMFVPFAFNAIMLGPYIFVLWALIVSIFFISSILKLAEHGFAAIVFCFVFALLMFVLYTIRSSVVHLPVIVSLLIFMQRIPMRKRILCMAIVLLSFYTAKSLYDNYLHDRFPDASVTHVIWHAVWCGFGEDPVNPVGALFADDNALAKAKMVDSLVEYGSSHYEKIMKDEVIKAISNHPLWYMKLFSVRLLKLMISRQNYSNLPIFGNENMLIFRGTSVLISFVLFLITYSYLIFNFKILLNNREYLILFLPFYVLLTNLPFFAIMKNVNMPIILINVIFLYPSLVWISQLINRYRLGKMRNQHSDHLEHKRKSIAS